MARQTRQQRRARRAQQEPALAGGPPPRGPAKPTANGGAEPSREPSRGSGSGRPRRADEHEKHGFGPWVFVQESIGELKKVEWPGQSQVVQATTVVIIACIIVGTWLYANDFVWQRVFKDFLLK